MCKPSPRLCSLPLKTALDPAVRPRAAVRVCTHIVEVEPISADGVQNPQQQNDLQRGVVKRNALWRFRYEVRLQRVTDTWTHSICDKHTHTSNWCLCSYESNRMVVIAIRNSKTGFEARLSINLPFKSARKQWKQTLITLSQNS